MKRRLLYITFANKQVYTGGGKATACNQLAIKNCLGEKDVDIYIIEPVDEKHDLNFFVRRISEIIKQYMGGLTKQHLNNILKMLDTSVYTDLFIDNSLLGYVAKVARKRYPHLRIYTFFHNMEYDFISSLVWDNKDYLHSFLIPSAKYNERCACHYSDKIIALNNRDAARIKEIYNRNADMIIPIWIAKDNYVTSQNLPTEKGCKEALFVGSYFFGNTQGLKWFCTEVLPYVNIHLTIVGSGMEAFAEDIALPENVSIHSNVPSLQSYYEQADFVVLPITTGGGMKVKTAETLKYGKYIIGTSEALEGYEVNNEMATVCNTAKEFIDAIKGFNRSFKFNEPSRLLFKNKYCYSAVISRYAEILDTPIPE